MRMGNEAAFAVAAWQTHHADKMMDSQSMLHKIDKGMLTREWTKLLTHFQVADLT